MKVLFLVADREQVSCRFRVLQYLPHLRRRGLTVEVRDLHVPPAQRWRALASARAVDVVVVHRALLGRLELALLRRAARRWVFDFDDAIMYRDSAAAHQQSWQRRLRFARMARAADGVIAGNDYLAAWARRYGDHVTVVPTAVDLADYPRVADFSGPPTVGWIGTNVNLMYLTAIAPALRRVAARCREMRLTIVSDGCGEVPGIPVTAKRWSAVDEAADLASFHVGLMPLADDPWTRGKCGVKLLQYMAAGVPVVCAPVGVNAQIVVDGVNGYHARTDDEWVARIVGLLGEPPLCRRLGQAGRDTVEQGYSVDVQLDRLLAVLGAAS